MHSKIRGSEGEEEAKKGAQTGKGNDGQKCRQTSAQMKGSPLSGSRKKRRVDAHDDDDFRGQEQDYGVRGRRVSLASAQMLTS